MRSPEFDPNAQVAIVVANEVTAQSSENPNVGESGSSIAERMRIASTSLAVAAWSNTDFPLLLTSGIGLEQLGVNSWVAGSAISAIATAETYAASHLATKGMGNFTYEPKTTLGKSAAKSSLAVSLWRGAPSGIMIDKAVGKEITTKRRLLHAIPYGVAVGELWVAPSPVHETAVSVATPAVHEATETVAAHPLESITVTASFLAVCVARKLQKRRG